MREGVLIYDHESGRMDIRFGLLDFYGGLHCGECLEVNINGEWIPTRIELGSFWYLRGIRIANLNVQGRLSGSCCSGRGRVIAVWNGQPSGTKNTIMYARRNKIPVFNILDETNKQENNASC